METYYIKVGKRYEPIGWQQIGNHIPFGVWYVRKSEGGTSSTNILFWQPEAEVLDVKKACQQINLTEEIVKALKVFDEDTLKIYNLSRYEFAQKLSQEILK